MLAFVFMLASGLLERRLKAREGQRRPGLTCSTKSNDFFDRKFEINNVSEVLLPEVNTQINGQCC